MAKTLAGRRIAFLAADGVERVELDDPWQAIVDAGGTPELVSIESGEITAFDHLDKSDTRHVDRTAGEADVADYAGLVLPGGVANPDFLRANGDAVAFTRAFADAGKPIGVICHGPWTLIEARVVEGKRITSWPSLRTDLENAGATWVDEEVVIDGGLVSSRNPDDLPAFCTALVEELGSATA